MTIHEVVARFGISADTLRYYEKIGVIPPVRRTASGLRDYDEESLSWIRLAICLRNAGVSVGAVVEYRQLFDQGQDTIPARLALLRREYDSLETKRQQIIEAMQRLRSKIDVYENAEKTGRLDWSVPARTDSDTQ